MDIYIGGIAIIFTALGIWLALKLATPRKETIIVEKEVYLPTPPAPLPANAHFVLNEKLLEKFRISTRELQVLQLMATGLSNQEIATHLFISLNTIKTHSSSLFMKMEVKRRTQAIDKARKLGLIP
ncbi:MAG: response regulator transcription factor [Taibaiella sp.]|nr:response regulator transcription factor [Taibaiella sp.]